MENEEKNEKNKQRNNNNEEKENKTSKKYTYSRIPLTNEEKEEFERQSKLKISKMGGSIRRKKQIRRPKDIRGAKDIKKSKKMNKEKEIDLDEISEEGSHILKKDGKFVTSNKELVAKIKLSINNYEIKLKKEKEELEEKEKEDKEKEEKDDKI